MARPAQLESSYRGVSWHETTSQWQAHVADPSTGSPISLGLFGSEKDAAKSFDRASIALRGTDTATNFPASLYTKQEIDLEGQRLRNYWRPRPSSQYHGVYQTRGSTKWKAEIELYDVKQFLDFYEDETEAAQAVDEAIRATGAERAVILSKLNFIRETDYFNEDTWEEERIPRGATSRFLGVSYHQPTDKFLARLGRRHLGLFDSEDEAARAFDKASGAAGGPTNFKPPSR